MSTIVYTKGQLIERVRKHISDGFSGDDLAVTDNELLLYIDSALAFGMIGQVYQNAKVDGNLAMPEAYLTTYILTGITQDLNTGYWTVTLPQPPVSLPLGYSIDRVYTVFPGQGVSKNFFFIKAKRVAYRQNLPFPNGISCWPEGSTLYLQANNNMPLNGLPIYVRMAKSRTDSISEPMNLPDDAIQNIFDKVIQELDNRYQQPKDEIKDYQGAGNSNQAGQTINPQQQNR
jgi:hypothetical protein